MTETKQEDINCTDLHNSVDWLVVGSVGPISILRTGKTCCANKYMNKEFIKSVLNRMQVPLFKNARAHK